MPRAGEEWTVDDLDRLPEDGLQYELLDGLLLVTPAPVLMHQRAPSVLALDLVDGQYAVSAEGGGDKVVRVERPFPLELSPAALMRPGGQ